MKKISFLITTLFIICLMCSISVAGKFEKTGEYYRYFEDDGSVAYDKFVEENRDRYYVNEEGYVVFKSWIEKDGKYYYAGNEGKLYLNGVYEIDKYKYYLNSEGELQKGWCGDYNYYGDLEDGYLINGFQELDVPNDFSTELAHEKTAWFYFDTNTYKRVYSENDPYITKTIGGRKYCFDQNGILRTGWRLIKDTTPVMRGYMYFVEDTTDEFKFGEAVTDSWYAVEPPVDVLPSSEVRYFYFNGQGVPRVSQTGKFSKVRIGEKTFLFNEYGFAVYGVHEINGDYYYFGPSVQDCSMKVGQITTSIDGSNDGSSFFFENDGRGLTGVKNNKLYYKGKLQMAEIDQKYVGVKINNLVYLVNQSGIIQKNRKNVKDSDGSAWTTNSSGIVTRHDDDANIVDAKAPDLSGDN